MSVTQFGKISLQLDTVHPFKALCRSLESSDVLLESKRSPSNTDGLLFSPGFLYWCYPLLLPWFTLDSPKISLLMSPCFPHVSLWIFLRCPYWCSLPFFSPGNSHGILNDAPTYVLMFSFCFPSDSLKMSLLMSHPLFLLGFPLDSPPCFLVGFSKKCLRWCPSPSSSMDPPLGFPEREIMPAGPASPSLRWSISFKRLR